MKTKLIGFCNMKKREGKVIFLMIDNQNGVTGQACKIEYVYDALSDKINASSIGHEILLIYNSGYNGKAYISDVVIK